MKLYYWIALSNVNECHSVVGKTKDEVWLKILNTNEAKDYALPVRRVLEFKDSFELFDLVTGINGGRNSGSIV